MALEYCFQVEDPITHKLDMICVPIPVNPWWWLDDPDPWIIRLGPRPEPWINDERLNPKVARDLTILATITKLTERLNPGLNETLQSGIKGAIEQLQLPAEATVGF